MQNLCKLSQKIRSWNILGYSLLPSIQIAIIHSQIHTQEVIYLLKQLECSQILYKQFSTSSKQLNKNKKQTQQEKFNQQKIDLDLTQNQEKKNQNISSIEPKQTSQKQDLQQKIHQQIFLQSYDKRLQNCAYSIFLLHQKIQARVHLVIDQQKYDLKQTKKIIQTLKRNKELILINFSPIPLSKVDQFSNHIEKFGLNFGMKDRQININDIIIQNSKKYKRLKKIEPLDSNQEKNNPKIISNVYHTQKILQMISKKYQNVFAIQINRNYLQMKTSLKCLHSDLERYKQVVELELLDGKNDLTSYSLKCLYRSKEYLIASLMGTFTNLEMQVQRVNKHDKKARYAKRTRSIHWEVMQLINQLWAIQGDALIKDIDKMPLSYIQEKYKMLNYQSLGGFMPSSCFQAIFSPPLRKAISQISQTLKAIQYKILKEIQIVYEYYFSKINILDDILDRELQKIKNICIKFRQECNRSLNSQIDYISTSPEDFWGYRQVKSNLYGPEMQVYIEIKYIGKTYIKKVFQTIKDSVPRFIGQNLLKQICYHLQNQSLNSLMQVTKQTPIKILISQQQKQIYLNQKRQYEQIDKLVYFFSLKVNSCYAIKNYHQKSQKNWNRMFKNNRVIEQQTKNEQIQQSKGILAWAKKLFIRKNKPTRKRASSQEKLQIKNQEIEQINIKKTQQPNHTLSQKNWLLIINISKQVDQNKIDQSSRQGFPSRLRAAIWTYLASKSSKQKLKTAKLIQSALGLSDQQKKQLKEIDRQILKDVNRTPPARLFKTGNFHTSINRVLQAYSIYDKQLRYTQGMNFISGIVLCVLTHQGQKQNYLSESQGIKYNDLQDKCLNILVFLMYDRGLRDIMFISRQLISDLCIRLQKRIQQLSPIMYQKIQESGFNCEMIFTGSLISGLTTSQINYNLQKRVLDLAFTRGFKILYRVIAQFVANSQKLCQKMSSQNIYNFLKNKVYDSVHESVGDQGITQMFYNI